MEDVSTTGTIDQVWAVITPPDYAPPDPSEPVIELPTVELADMGGGRHEGNYSEFDSVGTYGIAVYAMDAQGNISLTKQTQVTYAGEGPCAAATSAEASGFTGHIAPRSVSWNYLLILFVSWHTLH